MRKQQQLQEASLGEFVNAKVEAAGQRFDDWFGTDKNAEKTFMATFASFSVLSAGTEVAAHLLSEREGRKANVQRGALHAASLVSLAGAGVSLVLEGVVIGERGDAQRR